jgi:hypothetical protein
MRLMPRILPDRAAYLAAVFSVAQSDKALPDSEMQS